MINCQEDNSKVSKTFVAESGLQILKSWNSKFGSKVSPTTVYPFKKITTEPSNVSKSHPERPHKLAHGRKSRVESKRLRLGKSIFRKLFQTDEVRSND